MAFSTLNTFSSRTSKCNYKLKNYLPQNTGALGTIGPYTLYQFNSTPLTTLSFYSGSTIYILSVAGGGSGIGGGGGGGGAGGVVQQTTTLTVDDILTISIGEGGLDSNGTNTIVAFTNDTSKNITSIGGGRGGVGGTKLSGLAGGSGGGCPRDSGPIAGGKGTTGQGFDGGQGTSWSWSGASGGGGADMIGGFGGNAINSASGQFSGNGGDGIICTLPGINNYYPTIYWGGGGGGACDIATPINVENTTLFSTKNSINTPRTAASSTMCNSAGIGGFGGGGGGGDKQTRDIGGDTNGINNGSGGVLKDGGNGGTNTGGGGGGGGNSGGKGGRGGSGIVIVAILTNQL